MAKFIGYECSLCGKQYDASWQGYVCQEDGGNLNVLLDYERIRSTVNPETIMASRERSLWRYEPLLPVSDPGFHQTPLHSAGWTPVYRLNELACEIGVANLWVKDGRNPTAPRKTVPAPC